MKLKIAIVNRHPKDVIGGSEIQCAGIATRLSERNHEVFYIAPAGKNNVDYETNYTVIPVASNANSIAEAVINIKPDIVYWRLNKYHFYKAAKKIATHHIPTVFNVSHISDTKLWSCYENMSSGIIQFFKGLKQGILNIYNHQGFRYIKGVTVINPDHLNLLPIKYQCFIPNSITEETLTFNWPRPFIVWVSNLKPAKQPELFVSLAKIFEHQGIDFLMVGDIQFSDYEWIRHENLRTSNFHFLGLKNLKEVNGIIEKSLFLVHTCKPEGFGSVFIQAWLKGKPTISLGFDPGGYIQNNNLGGYAANSWDFFVERVQDLIKDSVQRVQTGERAYNFATQIFSAIKTTQTLESFLNKIQAESKTNH